MEPLRSCSLDTANQASLRAGIKWDPLERDNIEELHSFGSAEEARKKLAAIPRQISMLSLFAALCHATIVLNRLGNRLEDERAYKLDQKKALEIFLKQDRLPSYDLDLCCFCYDKAGKWLGYALPDYTEMFGNNEWKSSFVHSGDDDTGTGATFDEQLLINLRTMPAQIHQIFIVVVSVNHGFDRIKGGFWSIVNTKNEEELMSVLMKTAQKHRLHIMASVSRDEASWRVKELSDYCPVENGEKTPLQNQIDKLIRDRYLKEVPV